MVDIEQLIERVKQNKFLFDPNHDDYKNTSLKNTTWELIGRELNTTGELCRVEWKTLRDEYIMHKRQLTKAGWTKDVYEWSEDLKFLDDYNVQQRSFFRSAGIRKTESQDRDNLQNALSVVPPPLAPMQSDQNFTRTLVLSLDENDFIFLKHSNRFKKYPMKYQDIMKVELAKYFARKNQQIQRKCIYRSVSKRQANSIENLLSFDSDDESPVSPPPPVQPDEELRTNDTRTLEVTLDANDFLFLSYSDTLKRYPVKYQDHLKAETAEYFANKNQLLDAEQSRILDNMRNTDSTESETTEESSSSAGVINERPAKRKRRNDSTD